MAEAATESDDSDVKTCNRCAKPSDEYRTLDCNHIACLPCLGQLTRNGITMCPKCRTVCELPVIDQSNAEAEPEISPAEAEICAKCMKTPSIIFCEECNERLCNSCYEPCKAKLLEKVAQLRSKSEKIIAQYQQQLVNIAQEKVNLNQQVSRVTMQIRQRSSELIEAFKKEVTENEKRVLAQVSRQTNEGIEELQGISAAILSQMAAAHPELKPETEEIDEDKTEDHSEHDQSGE